MNTLNCQVFKFQAFYFLLHFINITSQKVFHSLTHLTGLNIYQIKSNINIIIIRIKSIKDLNTPLAAIQIIKLLYLICGIKNWWFQEFNYFFRRRQTKTGKIVCVSFHLKTNTLHVQCISSSLAFFEPRIPHSCLSFFNFPI